MILYILFSEKFNLEHYWSFLSVYICCTLVWFQFLSTICTKTGILEQDLLFIYILFYKQNAYKHT